MSKNQLVENVSRRIKNVYKTALIEFEKQFPNLVNSKEWSIARFNILTVGNDSIRATQQELDDYENGVNTFSVRETETSTYVKQSPEFVGLLKNTIFNMESIIFIADGPKQEKCLSLLHKELDFSLINVEDNIVKLFLCGLDACVGNLDILDYLLWPSPDTKREYITWRKRIANHYKELG